MMSVSWIGSWNLDLEDEHLEGVQFRGSILFANHKANGVVTNIGFLGDTVDDTGSYMAV